MKKLILILMLGGCTSQQETSSIQDSQTSTTQSESKVIEIDLKTLLDEFDSKRDMEYEMNKKYVGETLKVRGRTSGVNEDGTLILQLQPYENGIECHGISDNDFLISVKKNDIVEITGILQRENVPYIGKVCVLRNCSEWKKIDK
jgi:hypothetical protein